tara:strand:- start:304 stop:528 length:225 start_codon:yes stop_codon:yes gene_type:complete
MRKVLDALTILSTILVLGILGGGFFTYKYVTSEQFKTKLLNHVMGRVDEVLPTQIQSQMPTQTTGIIPLQMPDK